MPRSSTLSAPFAGFVVAVLPIGNFALIIVLIVVADMGTVLFIAQLIARRRNKTIGSIAVIGEEMPIRLRRRTEPGLRAHRPGGVVEMQVRWRQAAEAHRRARKTT